MTKIQWAEAVWNPIVGCSVVSPGCTNCYAMKDAWRKGFNPKTPQYHRLTRKVNGQSVWTGEVRLVEHKLTEPLKRQKPTTYFVNSMGDLFHEDVPDEWIDRVFAVMALCPQHIFQVLTKRAARMREYVTPYDRRRADSLGEKVIALGYDGHLESLRWPLPNVWLGVSAEDQRRADERIPDLLDTPAALRFVSYEPALGPVNFACLDAKVCWMDALNGDVSYPVPGGEGHLRRESGHIPSLDWIIVGGESGPGARWEDNPEVVALTFTVHQQNIDAMGSAG